MSSIQRDQEQLSMRLSEVFDDIGVSDEIIQKRRQSALFRESGFNVLYWLDNKKNTKYFFGNKIQCISNTPYK
ncbi:hypothetical protein ACF0H5_023227 [Mactra antiquata]